jgi:hypothetical protein
MKNKGNKQPTIKHLKGVKEKLRTIGKTGDKLHLGRGVPD